MTHKDQRPTRPEKQLRYDFMRKYGQELTLIQETKRNSHRATDMYLYPAHGRTPTAAVATAQNERRQPPASSRRQ